MFTKSALEGIFFQMGNPLGKGLEQEFQKAITYVNTLNYIGIADGDKLKYRHTQTHKYATSTLFPALAKIIKDTTNLTVSKFIDVQRFSGFFAVDMSLDSYQDVTAILTNQSGIGIEPISLDESAQEVAQLHTKFDEENSKILTAVFGKDMSRKIQVIMYMDVDMAFLMNDNFPIGIAESFTARELTAIYLHEIGHPLTMFAQAGNMYLQLERITKQLRVSSKQSMDPKKFVEAYTKKIRPNLTDAVGKKIISEKVLETSDAMYDKVKYYDQTDKSDYLFGTGELIWNLVIRGIAGLSMMWARSFYYKYLYAVVETIIYFQSKPGSNAKVSDVANSPRAAYNIERMADEFAVRHGYGGSLATGLAKLTSVIEILSTTTIAGGKIRSKSLRDSYIFVSYLKFTVGLMTFFRMHTSTITEDFFGANSYEKDTARLKRIIQQISTAFKNDMPKEMTNQYLSELESAKNALDEISSFPKKVSNLLWTYVFDFPTIISKLIQNDQPEEMADMLDQLDDLINNEMYAHAAAFKHM